jgi:hypothetical protein
MLEVAFIAGAVAGVVRERTYQAVDQNMDLTTGLKHVGEGLLTEPRYAYRALRRVFGFGAEAVQGAATKAREQIKLVLTPETGPRASMSVPLAD